MPRETMDQTLERIAREELEITTLAILLNGSQDEEISVDRIGNVGSDRRSYEIL